MKTAMDYEREERKAMIPPLCPVCHRRASERRGWASRPGYKSKHVRVLGHCLSPFHDAGDWGPALLEACKELCDAADAFLATPPDDMKDFIPFGQPTIAKDCRALNAAYAKAYTLVGKLLKG